jgi:hypothetical protein
MSGMMIGGAKHATIHTDRGGFDVDAFKTRTELAEQAIRSAWSDFPPGGAEHVAWLERQVEELREHNGLPFSNADPMSLLCHAIKVAWRMSGADGDDLRHTLRLLAQHIRRGTAGVNTDGGKSNGL